MKLWCENGQHHWNKEGRGRPPKNCPDHRPVDAPVKVIGHTTITGPKTATDLVPGLAEALQQESMRELWCMDGSHFWNAPRQRGRAPRNCPEHRPEIPVKPRTEGKATRHQAEIISAIVDKPKSISCSCGITPEITLQELRALNGGCTMPYFCCPTLDSIRRSLNL